MNGVGFRMIVLSGYEVFPSDSFNIVIVRKMYTLCICVFFVYVL